MMVAKEDTAQWLSFLVLALALIGCEGGEQTVLAPSDRIEANESPPASSQQPDEVDANSLQERHDPVEAAHDDDWQQDLQDIPPRNERQDDGPHTSSAEELVRQREILDKTLWAPEVSAQRYEETFIQLWDALRLRDDKYEVARSFSFDRLTMPRGVDRRDMQLGIQIAALRGETQSYTLDQWRAQLDHFEASGYRIVQSEWHHADFQAAKSPPTSVVNFAVDLERAEPARRVSIRGKLDVTWEPTAAKGDLPRPATIAVRDAELLYRDSLQGFHEIFRATTDSQHKRLMPLLLYDLNGDGLSEILSGGLNRIYWNEGAGKFRESPIAADGLDIFDAAVLGDFDGDGRVDLVCVGTTRRPLLLHGTAGGFEAAPTPCADSVFELPKSFTCGDVDGDGDLDLWIGQYKFPYLGGAMPTPFYDANDGYPSALLLNDGQGQFDDVTAERGLAEKRTRRTFSSSLVDLDDDGDLDLMTVNDFAGVDIYENDGQGYFTDVSTSWVDHRHLFGMGHTFADFNLDGRPDMYLIGMSSTTARRLEAMGLVRDDHPDINRMRMAMGYGNRMLLGQAADANLRFKQADHNDLVCRTGWSWGTSSFDLENDGDPDILVVNGHNSGKSAKDYCTRYWCHDVYTGTSQESSELHKLFGLSLTELHRGEISWNGFEHNVLWLNEGGSSFTNVAFLLGVGAEYDSRAAASDDLDGDGRQDLLAVEYRSNRLGHAEYTLHVLRNEVADVGHWIGVRLDEASSGRSPVGAKVTIRTSDRTRVKQIINGDSFSTQHAPIAHFGLGETESVKLLTIAWPDGTKATVTSPKIDRYYLRPGLEAATQ